MKLVRVAQSSISNVQWNLDWQGTYSKHRRVGTIRTLVIAPNVNWVKRGLAAAAAMTAVR